jgi:hypothetical protein
VFARRSRKAILAGLRRRFSGKPPAHKLIVKTTPGNETIGSAGKGAPLILTVADRAAPFIRAIAKYDRKGAATAEFLLMEDESSAYWEAGIIALLLSIIKAKAVGRIYAAGKSDALAVQIYLRQILPSAWLELSDEAAGLYRIGPDSTLELESIKKRHMWMLCDVAMVSDYRATSQGTVERALAAAPLRILYGPTPKTPSQLWIGKYQETARAAGRSFR